MSPSIDLFLNNRLHAMEKEILKTFPPELFEHINYREEGLSDWKLCQDYAVGGTLLIGILKHKESWRLAAVTTGAWGIAEHSPVFVTKEDHPAITPLVKQCIVMNWYSMMRELDVYFRCWLLESELGASRS